MKALQAILACLFLVLSQAGFSAPSLEFPASPVTPPVCRHCDCGGTGCCVQESAPLPTQVPAAPRPAGGGLHDLSLLPVPPASPAPGFEVAAIPAIHTPSVPPPSRATFQARFCVFLI